MTDTTQAPPAQVTASPPPAPPPAPWHAGIEPEILGHWQNKGWKVDDPKEIALAATKQAREAEKFFGVPPDQILKLPKADAKPEDIKAFRMRLGMPAESKEYDLSGIKNAAGEPMDDGLADALRASFHAAGVPKDSASTIAAAVQKRLDDAAIAQGLQLQAKIDEAKAQLRESWKNNYDYNRLKALEGARRLGISQEAANLLENQIGGVAVMEALRKIGMGTTEDTFIERGATNGGVPHTREGAVARKQELMSDLDWGKRYLSGGMAERREMDALNRMIDGDA